MNLLSVGYSNPVKCLTFEDIRYVYFISTPPNANIGLANRASKNLNKI